MWFRGSTLVLGQGSFRLSSDELKFSPQLHYGENEGFLKTFVLAYVKLLSDSPLEPFGVKPLQVYKRFVRCLTTQDLRSTIKRFSGLCNELMSSEFVTGGESSQRLFILAFKDTPVFKEYHEWYRTGRPDLCRFLLSFLLFGKKLAYVDDDLNQVAFRGWLQVEDGLRTLTFGDNDLRSLRNIVDAILPTFRPTDLLPTFGPGKVSERSIRDVADKLDQLVSHPRLEYAFNRERPYASRDEGYGVMQNVVKLSGDSLDVSRLKFVPKDISKSRSICMEPNAFMYFQQEVLRALGSSMRRGRIQRFVNLRDQTRNQRAAIHGSKYLSLDTLDLSSASDSVHIDLVRRVFSPGWLFLLLATRTSKVELPDGKVVTVSKFAPMGSAVCFPVQCIIFTAIALYGYEAHRRGEPTGSFVMTKEDAIKLIDRHLHKDFGPDTPFTGRYEPPVIFGDDIICDSRVTGDVVSTLNRLGFRTNDDKSFTGSQAFRESCGVFACQGEDVTPVRFQLPWHQPGKMDAKVFASYVGAINRFRALRYHNVAAYLQSVLEDGRGKTRLPYSTNPDAFGIHVSKRRVVLEHLRLGHDRRWNIDLQRWEERVLGIGNRKVRKEPSWNLETYRYNQWWRSRVSESDHTPDWGSLLIRPQETRISAVWTRWEE